MVINCWRWICVEGTQQLDLLPSLLTLNLTRHDYHPLWTAYMARSWSCLWTQSYLTAGEEDFVSHMYRDQTCLSSTVVVEYHQVMAHYIWVCRFSIVLHHVEWSWWWRRVPVRWSMEQTHHIREVMPTINQEPCWFHPQRSVAQQNESRRSQRRFYQEKGSKTSCLVVAGRTAEEDCEEVKNPHFHHMELLEKVSEIR